ncbi:MAG: hypothetical protein KC503_14000 [Myxococcales bacterium]|nr:hypothetical protein [Myxococcales bacterium]
MTMVWDEIERLGRRIGEAWARTSRDEAAFAALSHEAVTRAEPWRTLSVEALAEAALEHDRVPVQTRFSEQFGEPSVVLFRGESFTIEVLFWVDGLVSIHQHRFSGAFCVLAGSSIHCRYRFAEARRVNAWLRLGALELAHAELLARGAVRPIPSGPDLIHSTFHLDRPTITLVVRTDADIESGAQLEYRRPSVAIDPRALTPQQQKRLELLQTLRAVRSDLYWPMVERVLAQGDLAEAYLLLHESRASLDDAGCQRILALARDVHGEALDGFVPSLADGDRVRSAMWLRRATDDDELRFFLALLLQVPSRAAILEMVGERYPGVDPVERVVAWVERIEVDGAPLIERAAAARWLALFRELVGGRTDRAEIKAALAARGLSYRNDFELYSELTALREIPLFAALTC